MAPFVLQRHGVAHIVVPHTIFIITISKTHISLKPPISSESEYNSDLGIFNSYALIIMAPFSLQRHGIVIIIVVPTTTFITNSKTCIY